MVDRDMVGLHGCILVAFLANSVLDRAGKLVALSVLGQVTLAFEHQAYFLCACSDSLAAGNCRLHSILQASSPSRLGDPLSGQFRSTERLFYV